MKLSDKLIGLLIGLMKNSAQKGNLANSGLVLEDNKLLASAESLVASGHDATAHSERVLVAKVCRLKKQQLYARVADDFRC
ncbi:hypothetical protein A2690_01695 [Candidatus Roizmanbacteria bacterium RIFCSPHIGHO2_01_FULL_39_12b]|uniref:Uncharacterized protein n=1 Tax=Candidatus Roizmanbacteria bacterium RIFCSPHIGHO2_01_FULL_39_12b TaxID=1802030 RepID=A0A1F7GB36_9BACT|nr:MAG: hypothetical protein A2690_01695 [Candidatus Roizmanbacteria bacterium RIFCSPHIGHO2_01_FULL_39_12b]OGK46134.1 MAG: hypothetical protein A3B46_02940 [Candidatus Roizmanbacteria bacterium RIFCSPLOWO2_01_FULL_39_19]